MLAFIPIALIALLIVAYIEHERRIDAHAAETRRLEVSTPEGRAAVAAHNRRIAERKARLAAAQREASE